MRSEDSWYEKEFLSKKGKTCKGTGNFGQEHSEEDDNLRNEIQKKFDIIGTNGRGFDGRVMYEYSYYQGLGPQINVEESVRYKTKCCIVKAGTLENISKPCELEEFLLEKGFKKIENKS
jgi:hypothetical protein